MSHLCFFRAGQRQPDNREQVQQGGEEEASWIWIPTTAIRPGAPGKNGYSAQIPRAILPGGKEKSQGV